MYRNETTIRMTEKYLDNFIVYQNTVLQSFLKPFYFGQDSFFLLFRNRLGTERSWKDKGRGGKRVRSKTLSKNKHLSTPSDTMNHTTIIIVSPSVNFGNFPFNIRGSEPLHMPGNRALYPSSYNLTDMDGQYWCHAFHKQTKLRKWHFQAAVSG